MREINRSVLTQKLDSRLALDIEENKLFGAVLHVSQNGRTVYQKAMGTGVFEDTVFRIASMTKPITAVAAMILVERGLLRLDDPVERYIHEFYDMRIASVNDKGDLLDSGAAVGKPTIRNILTHTSGIGSGVVGAAQIAKMSAQDRQSVSDTVVYFANQGLSFSPGTKQEYSGFPAYDVLTAIIEKLTGEDYGQFLQREIFSKCNMIDTAFSPNCSQWDRLAVMHNKVDGKNAVVKMPAGCVFERIPCSHNLGGAGLVSTASDYANFAQMLLRKGCYGNTRILSEESVEEISKPQVPAAIQPGLQRWGLGVRVITSRDYGTLPVGAYGWSGAYGPHFWVDPVNRITAIYMKNSRYDPGAGSATGYHFEEDVYSAM